MAEQIILTTPTTTPSSSTTSFKVARLLLNPEQALIVIVVRGTRGEIIEATREGSVATNLMQILNKANGTIKSLEKRAMEWLQTQPEGALLQGTITGTPD